ncbi:helix-turn-helix transcriptional regulator [Amycolatopsis minnesotensis]|uniref:Helix-turn-helix transcriptional regulator n=1 Tax=Amycolatopsis minnesotensis TaxID=337894 RepID=A0ABN2RCY8_9PSEU
MGLARQPNYRERQLGRTLRRLREQSRMSQEESAGRLRFSPSKMSRIEQGQARNYHEFLAMLDLYGVLTSEYEPYVRLFDRAQERGWWSVYGIADRGFVAMEAEAAKISSYQLGFVPGLLQTEKYMRATYAAARHPWRGKRLETEVEVRLRRTKRLHADPVLDLHAVLEESVVRRPTCDRAQLEHILSTAVLPNVTLQVLPQAVGSHDGLYSSFLVVDFPEADEASIAYLEYGFGTLEMEREEQVRLARLTFEHLAGLALDEARSVELIKQVIAGT